MNLHVSVKLLSPVKVLLADRAGQPPPRRRRVRLPVRLLLVLAEPTLLAKRLEAVLLVAGVHVGRHGLAVGRDQCAGAERVRAHERSGRVATLFVAVERHLAFKHLVADFTFETAAGAAFAFVKVSTGRRTRRGGGRGRGRGFPQQRVCHSRRGDSGWLQRRRRAHRRDRPHVARHVLLVVARMLEVPAANVAVVHGTGCGVGADDLIRHGRAEDVAQVRIGACQAGRGR